MPAINDIVISLSSAAATAARQAFGVPLLLGFTGQRAILVSGAGASGIVYKSVVRNDSAVTVVVETGPGFAYAAVGSAVTITVPVGTIVRDLIADFNANAGAPVKALISLERLSTGSGIVPLIAVATNLAFTAYRDIRDITQLDYYYDDTDIEYIAIGNYLASRPTPGRLYLLDVFGTVDIAADIATYDTGDWWLILSTSTTEANLQIIADYVNIRQRAMLAVSSDVAILDTVQGRNVMFIIHPAPDDHPEISLAAYKLPAQPGSTTWKFAGPLQGQTPNTTSTLDQLITVRNNRGQSYVTRSGISYVDGARMNDPTAIVYMDQVISRDWVSLNMEVDLLELFTQASARNEKISYTNAGIQKITGVIERRLSIAGQFDIIAPVETPAQAEASSDGVYRFNVKSKTREFIEANSPNDITNRVLNYVEFQYVEAGAIEGINPVTGRVIITE